ncbi:MAG: DUF192 domain-containing protein [Candidatus Eremiobacteraeota bacterium]|nr:DUF192 domain-containing protein [Candidatus Eremiobacteraeota bacterium]MBV9737110.1 DUF192 domain-containing protein [Candidatus Eremiobacteraeota bacterium]
MTILSALTLAATLAAQPASTPQPLLTLKAPLAVLSLEVADTEAKQERGLMYRTALPTHSGMIFIFNRDDVVEFWMKNTLIPLDMVFVAADGQVRSVSADVPAATLDTPDDRVARVLGRAKYVIELPAGEAAGDGLRAGAQLPELAKQP